MKKLLQRLWTEGVFLYPAVSLVGKPVYVTDLHTQLVRVFTDFRINQLGINLVERMDLWPNTFCRVSSGIPFKMARTAKV